MRPIRSRARSLEDCLKADPGIARLSGHAARLLGLQAVFAAAAPQPLARSARVANLKLGRVVILADTGAVAAKLRQLAPRLVDAFRYEAAEVTGIDIRVQPGSGKTTAARKDTRAVIGDQTKQGLTLLAAGLPRDSRLRAALERLVEKG